MGLFGIESSPLAWNRLARAIATERGLDLWANARLVGLLTLAMADGYIASWDTKYHYRFWRPITAIRLGDEMAIPARRAIQTGRRCNGPIPYRTTIPDTSCRGVWPRKC